MAGGAEGRGMVFLFAGRGFDSPTPHNEVPVRSGRRAGQMGNLCVQKGTKARSCYLAHLESLKPCPRSFDSSSLNQTHGMELSKIGQEIGQNWLIIS